MAFCKIQFYFVTKALTTPCKEENLFKPLEKPTVKTPKSNIILCDDFSLR